MEFAQERLAREVLEWAPVGDYCPWPRRTVTADAATELATHRSRLTKTRTAVDYDRSVDPRGADKLP